MLSDSDPILINVEELDDTQTSNSYSNTIAKWPIGGNQPKLRTNSPKPKPAPSPTLTWPYRRLLVIVPNADLHEARLAQRISGMAIQNHASVLFLTICTDWAEEPGTRLRLALLTALMEGAEITTQSEIIFHEDWATVLRRFYIAGDLLVCFPEHIDASKAASNLHLPVCNLQGYVIALEPPRRWRHMLRGWLLPLGLALGMFAFQIFLVQWAHDWSEWSRKTLMSVTIIVELLSIASWAKG